MYVLFVIFKPNFQVDSPNSNFRFFPRSVLQTSLLTYANEGMKQVLGAPNGKSGDWLGMRLHCVLVLCEQQLQNAAFCKESFVFTCLVYKYVQRFQNEPVHEFYGLKASQMSKIRASYHKNPHGEKIKNLRGKKFKVEATKKNLLVRILNEAT